MAEKSPAIKEWQKLYELMGKIKELAPWDWLEEQDIFAVQNPETGEIGFVSVMGALGEHYSIAIYRGEDGLRKFLDYADNYSEDDELRIQKLLEIPQLQASFEDRKVIQNKDLETIKKLGLSFRGKNAWPSFRSFEPGFVPWYINSSEARFLAYVLEQTLDVSPRADENSDLLFPDNSKGFLLRKPSRKGEEIFWQDDIWQESKKSLPKTYHFPGSTDLEKLKHLPQGDLSLEIDVFMSHFAADDKNNKPYYPYLLMMLEIRSGMIVGYELIPPLPNLAEMWKNMPSIILKALLKSSALPKQIYVETEDLYLILLQLTENLKTSVTYVEKLICAPEARKSYLSFAKR